jgi:predicted DNA-binding transcriptional regulator AlpA
LTTSMYLTIPEAGDYLNVNKRLLDRWRSEGDGPPYVKLKGTVRYSVTDLDEWMKSRTVNP